MPISENKVRLIFTTDKEVLREIEKIQSEDKLFNRSKLINQIFLIGLKEYARR